MQEMELQKRMEEMEQRIMQEMEQGMKEMEKRMRAMKSKMMDMDMEKRMLGLRIQELERQRRMQEQKELKEIIRQEMEEAILCRKRPHPPTFKEAT